MAVSGSHLDAHHTTRQQTPQMSQLYEMQQLDKIKAICQVAQDDMAKLSEVR